jgi:hypothetical protein
MATRITQWTGQRPADGDQHCLLPLRPTPTPHRIARSSFGLWTCHQVFGAKESIESEGIVTKTGTYPLLLNPNEDRRLKA